MKPTDDEVLVLYELEWELEGIDRQLERAGRHRTIDRFRQLTTYVLAALMVCGAAWVPMREFAEFMRFIRPGLPR